MLSPADMLILGAAALLFFGPDQLPKVARKAGHVMRDIQSTSQSFIREMERAADEAEFKEATARMEPVVPAPDLGPVAAATDPAPATHVPEAVPVAAEPVSHFSEPAPIPGSVPRPEVNVHEPLDATMNAAAPAIPWANGAVPLDPPVDGAAQSDPMRAGHMPPERASDTP